MKEDRRHEEHRLLVLWAAACAGHVLPFFEEAYPEDDRPREAIAALRAWVRTGIFRMADIRRVSLAAHAAAREAKDRSAARFAARAAGQAAAAAHVGRHAWGVAYYGLKATAAADPAGVAREMSWQSRRLPKELRPQWQEWRRQGLPKYLRRMIRSP